MTQDTDTREQLLSYVRHQAAKGLDGLAALMQRTAVDCDRCLEDVSEEQASFKYDEEWSIKEVLGHMLLSMAAVNGDIGRVAEGKEPRPTYGEGPTSGAERPIGELRQALAGLWAETARLAASLPESGGPEQTFEHPFFGPLNIREWIAFQRVHAMDHVQQIEKVKAHTDYPKA